ncbi:acetyl-CoA C-acyltransferase [Corchorus olitorius]|uniref:Acetyl-CoA C-acyltransferase n=1 Tax=Corchorus olitorius TaxID=93759 RepID=A0A1R3H124_9ROSI|nr:acetyl-CoA C-acyltransferase [Corchorus olitorius]
MGTGNPSKFHVETAIRVPAERQQAGGSKGDYPPYLLVNARSSWMQGDPKPQFCEKHFGFGSFAPT